MSEEFVLKTYEVLDQSSRRLSLELGTSYLEGLAETLQNLQFDQRAQQVDGLPQDATVQDLTQLYQGLNLKKIDRSSMRKATQLALLQAIKQDHIQANHHMTPDSIAFLLAVLAKHLVKGPTHLIDVTAGTGNLLSVLMDQLDGLEKVDAVEIDDILISVLSSSLALQGEKAHIYHQDAVLPLLLDPADLIVSDLPVGFYPFDEKVDGFKVQVSNEHTYAHHALMENSLSLLKEGGWGIYLVPANLFETNQAPQILSLLTQGDYKMQAFLSLPKSLFKAESARKAILLVQKPGQKAKKATEVMVAEVPSFKEPLAMQAFMNNFEQWAKTI